MLQLLRSKFNDHNLQGSLLATKDAELEEGNTCGDTVWGISPIGSGNGANMLGKLLMQVRDEYKQKRSEK